MNIMTRRQEKINAIASDLTVAELTVLQGTIGTMEFHSQLKIARVQASLNRYSAMRIRMQERKVY